jgi:hypothetical protein
MFLLRPFEGKTTGMKDNFRKRKQGGKKGQQEKDSSKKWGS